MAKNESFGEKLLWKVILVRVATLEGESHTSISVSGQLGFSLPRHLGSCWKGKHNTVCMYVCMYEH